MGNGRERKGMTIQLVTDKVIETLVLLEEKTRMMEERMGQIEAKVNEFIKNKSVDNPARESRARALVGPKAHRRTQGLVMMASPTEPRPVEQDGKTSIALGTLTKRGWSWPEKMTSSYSGLQALLEDVAQGIEERQAELEEMTRGIEERQNELKKVAKSMEDRQAQLEKAAKEIEDKRIKRIEKEIELTT
jgi:hypothetical protein